jgi:hypothetical protein
MDTIHNMNDLTHPKIKMGAFPPCYDNVCAAFQVNPLGVYFTYGDAIYVPNPSNYPPPDIIEHEKVHMKQQGYSEEGAAEWWGKFLRDPDFRIQQEAAAYARQYAFLVEDRRINGREQRFHVRWTLAGQLSGPMYGNAISRHDAAALIQRLSGVK